MTRVLIDLKPLADKVRFELALEMGDLPDSGLADVLGQIAEHEDYSEEIVTAALRSGLSFAVLEAAQLEVARRAERSLGADADRQKNADAVGTGASSRTVAVKNTQPEGSPSPDRTRGDATS
jgi:hypothetical protein